MHAWHDIYVDDHLIEKAFPVVIEVPMGSKNKYELDKETGLLKLDRVLYSAVHYPANYGFIPRTFCEDGDPLDALVLGQEPVNPLTMMDARAIGVMTTHDLAEADAICDYALFLVGGRVRAAGTREDLVASFHRADR